MATRENTDPKIKADVIKRANEGEKKEALAEEYKLNINTVRSWFRKPQGERTPRDHKPKLHEIDRTDVIRQSLTSVNASIEKIEKAYNEELPRLKDLQKILQTSLNALEEFDKITALE